MTNEEVENIPDHVKAAAFAVHVEGPVADGISAKHAGRAYDWLLAEQAEMQ